MQPIFQSDRQSGLRIVLTPGVNDRNTGQSGCDPPHDIGTNPAVEMDDIRMSQTDDPMKPLDQSKVEITLHANGMDFGQRRGHFGKIAPHPAREDILDSPSLEAFHEEKDLMRAAVKITTALNVEDLHGNCA